MYVGSPYRKWSVPMRPRAVETVTAIQRASSVTSAMFADRTRRASSTVKVRWAWPQRVEGKAKKREVRRKREAGSQTPPLEKAKRKRSMCNLR